MKRKSKGKYSEEPEQLLKELKLMQEHVQLSNIKQTCADPTTDSIDDQSEGVYPSHAAQVLELFDANAKKCKHSSVGFECEHKH